MTFVVKQRGGRGFVVAEYRCDWHGVFEAIVTRDANGDPPEAMSCPCEVDEINTCGEMAPWTISAPPVHTQFVITATRGKSDSKPHANSMDTRPLAEGQTYTEWRKERKKVWENERHKRVKRMLE